LYVPAEFAVQVYDLLAEAGQEYGLMNAGAYAINALRLEKGYRAFGPELNPDLGPVEAGLIFATKLKTDIEFLGRDAVQRARDEGVRRRLVSFVLADSVAMMWGGELLLRDGRATGQVTSAAYATTTGACVGLATAWQPDGDLVTTEYLRTGSWEVNVNGALLPVTVSLDAPYDPGNSRIRC